MGDKVSAIRVKVFMRLYVDKCASGRVTQIGFAAHYAELGNATSWISRTRFQKRASAAPYSTVTLFAKFLGLSTSVPRAQAVWYASNWSGTTCNSGDSSP